MPKSTTNLSLSTYDSVIDKDNLSKQWFDETFGYIDSNMTKIDDAYGRLKESVPTKTGEGASGDWDININGTAQTAINDGAGNDINSTYVKEITSDDGILNIKKGNNITSSIDISSPAGYILSKEAYFSKSSSYSDSMWYHIGDIKNTSDNDFIKINIDIYYLVNRDARSLYLHILDDVQSVQEALNEAYECVINSFSVGSEVVLIPTSGGNGSSSAEVWVKGSGTTASTILVTVETSKKGIFDFVLTRASTTTTSEFTIYPMRNAYLIDNNTTGSKTQKGIVQAGSGINANNGIISVAPPTSSNIGGVKSGNNVNITSDGTISVPNASSTSKGAVQVGENLTVDNGTVSLTKDNVSSAIGFTPTKITAGTVDLTAGTSTLETGTIYLYYT